MPDGNEQDAEAESEPEDESDDDDLDITKQRIFGIQGARQRTQAKPFGYQISRTAIAMTEDSE